MKIFLEKQKKVCSSKKIWGRVPHPQGRLWPQKFLKLSNFGQNHDFGLKSAFFGPFLHFCGATESQNIVNSTKKILEALWGVFGACRNFFGPPPHHPHFRPQKFLHQKKPILGNFRPKWVGEEISVAENTGCGCGVAGNFSARTENTLKCFQNFFVVLTIFWGSVVRKK